MHIVWGYLSIGEAAPTNFDNGNDGGYVLDKVLISGVKVLKIF